jgi:Spy/CpxP family protein refolding chaperone
MQRLLCLALLQALVALAASAQSDPTEPTPTAGVRVEGPMFEMRVPPPPEPDAWLAHYAQPLGIDDATVARIQAIAAESRADRERIVAQLQEEKLALREALHEERPDEGRVVELARSIGGLETDLSVSRLTAMVRMHAQLTPEQNAALHDKMEGSFRERRERMDGILTACDRDLAAHCADELEGPPPHQVMCLLQAKKQAAGTLSAACDEALSGLPPVHFFRHRLPPPDEEGDVLYRVPENANAD